MGYFDDLSNLDWQDGSAAAAFVLSSSTPASYRSLAKYNAQVERGLINPAEDMVPVWQRKPTIPITNKNNTTGRTRGKVNGRVRPKVNHTARFSGMNFTDDEKKIIMDAGFDPTNAMSVQNFILSKNKNANLGARRGAGIADGYWGDKSAAAFEALRNQGIFKPLVDAQEPVNPVNQTPVDAPDFGYKSEGNYSANQAGTLKTNGITDWSSLINYAGKNKDSDFTRLLSGYFGTNDITQWNRKKLETDAKIHGTYHGQDRAQLQGFLGGLLFRNNLLYYDRVADYSKKFTKPNPSGIGTLGSASETIMPDLISKKSNPIYGDIT